MPAVAQGIDDQPSTARVRNTKVRLASKFTKLPEPSHFTVDEEELVVDAGSLVEGEVWLRILHVSLEPYMQAQSLQDLEVGQLVEARSSGVVHASRSQQLNVGDVVWGFFALQAFVKLPPTLLDDRGYSVLHSKIAIDRWPSVAPLSWSLSVLGLSGLTAWCGMVEAGRAKAGDSVFISSAAGAVGLLAGQIAKALGCHVVGSAGTDEKCRIATNSGFDACFNYRNVICTGPIRSSQATHGIAQAISKHCPRGVDIFFDTVGGPTLDAAFITSKPRARIVICGALSEQLRPPDEMKYGVRFLPIMIEKMIEMKGFTVFDYYPDKMEEYVSQMCEWILEGKVTTYEEYFVDGLQNMPSAFCGMLRGDYAGKTLVSVSDDSFAANWAAPCRRMKGQ